ncbi:hypothetical protein [Marinilabilia salmonicolor]|uniref:Uncharacterized protein n=1 Tax=Marinilabilia salmonicolor TaxID=989 RepID=A0A2T0X628_9BACT|nr:hypothetical protein [Marinilabilia salmonicolor]PRY94412.1 hypothetical protein BY457_12065 [Marinilabilia salmonicolor]RCW29991.1 hypothetical protein DFO77_1242 [Marinilabilia salmonicolor]
MANKDDWDYEEDAFWVLEDALGQVSDLCYEILHSNLSITAAMMAPLLSSTTDELLEHIENGTLNQFVEASPGIDPTTVSVDQTDLKAREKARKAIYDAKKIILSQINNNSPSARINLELNHYSKNNLLQGKFRVLQLSRFLLTPADLVDFMIKDEQADPDPGIEFIEDFFASNGYLSSGYYSILTHAIDFDIYKLSEIHYAYWKEVIDIFGSVSIYKDVFPNQTRFMDILTSVNLKNGETSCSKNSFYKKKKRYHVEDYVLDIPEQKIQAIEKKYNAKLPVSRRFIFPETEFTKKDNRIEFFEVKTLVFNYEELLGMDELNGLRNASMELFELISGVNRKAVAWLSEEALNDENAPARTVHFSNIENYSQHIMKRQFGITGNNPNGTVFPDPRGSEELVYTGIVSDEWSPFYYKVYAMPYETIRGIHCEIEPDKMPTAVLKYIRINEYGDIHSIKLNNPTELSPEPFNSDGTLNRAYVNSDRKIRSGLLKSVYTSDNEKADIMRMSIHQGQKDFINHPVTKGTIFVLTSVITAGMMQGVAAGSRMLSRNAFKAAAKKALLGSGKLSAKTILSKAVVSVGYQTITQEGQVNLFTVIGDSFFTPFVGAALGNVFTVKYSILDWEIIEFDTIFKKNTDTKTLLAVITRTLIAGTLHKYGGETIKSSNFIFDTSTQVVIKSNENAIIQGLGKLIEQ